MAAGGGATRGGERTAIGWGLRPYRRASRVAFGMFMLLLAGRVPARPRDWAATLRRREEGEVSWSGRDAAAVVANVIVVVVGRGIRVIQLGPYISQVNISRLRSRGRSFSSSNKSSAAAAPAAGAAAAPVSSYGVVVSQSRRPNCSYSSGLRRFQHRPRDNARAAAAVQLNQSGIFMR